MFLDFSLLQHIYKSVLLLAIWDGGMYLCGDDTEEVSLTESPGGGNTYAGCVSICFR